MYINIHTHIYIYDILQIYAIQFWGYSILTYFDPCPFPTSPVAKKVPVRHRWLQCLRTRSQRQWYQDDATMYGSEKRDIEPENRIYTLQWR